MAPRITERQREVLLKLCEGSADKQIAASLGISITCVRKHIAECRRRVGARSREELVARAVKSGFWRDLRHEQQ